MYQVETVGDKYMAVSGLPEPCIDHARCIARLSLDMMDISNHLKDPYGNKIVVRLKMKAGYSQFVLQTHDYDRVLFSLGPNIVLVLINFRKLACDFLILCFIAKITNIREMIHYTCSCWT